MSKPLKNKKCETTYTFVVATAQSIEIGRCFTMLCPNALGVFAGKFRVLEKSQPLDPLKAPKNTSLIGCQKKPRKNTLEKS